MVGLAKGFIPSEQKLQPHFSGLLPADVYIKEGMDSKSYETSHLQEVMVP